MVRSNKAQPALSKSVQSSHVGKRAQQEMVGFTLIVVLVIVALMIFLVFELRDPPELVSSGKIGSMISTIGKYTTDCQKNGYYLDLEGVIKACYEDRQCSELGVSACDYMESELEDIMDSVMRTESIYSGYKFNITVTEDSGQGVAILYGRSEGNCTGLGEGAMERISLGSGEGINLMLRMCS